MQWRMLLRRVPAAVVHDRRRHRPGRRRIRRAELASTRSRPLIGDSPEGERWRLEELTVNYRTPSQIAAVAEAMAIAHGLPVTPARVGARERVAGRRS